MAVRRAVSRWIISVFGKRQSEQSSVAEDSLRAVSTAANGTTMTATKVSSRNYRSRLIIAGRFLPDFSKAGFSRERIMEIGSALLDTVELVDVIFLLVVSFLTVPLARTVHGMMCSIDDRHGGTTTRQDDDADTDTADSNNMKDEPVEDRFKCSYAYIVAESISQIAQIAMIVYVVDCLVIVVYLQGIEFALAQDIDFGSMAARILYTTWLGFRCMRFKRYLLGRIVNKSPEKLGKALIYDRVLDWIIYAILTFSVMDTLNIEVGAGLKSVFALSGVGTLVLSLASKDVATLFVSGLALSASEKFRTGDMIKLGDNTTGVVTRMGPLYTEVRGSDEIITKIPNSQLAGQRVSNLSRMFRCQVTQTLRFDYDDLPKLPVVLDAIKQEIEKTCPELIKDGSRPFRVDLNAFQADHIEVVVDTRYDLPPIGKVYFEHRQRVLEAIARAVTQHGVKFAIPEYHIIGEKRITTGGAT